VLQGIAFLLILPPLSCEKSARCCLCRLGLIFGQSKSRTRQKQLFPSSSELGEGGNTCFRAVRNWNSAETPVSGQFWIWGGRKQVFLPSSGFALAREKSRPIYISPYKPNAPVAQSQRGRLACSANFQFAPLRYCSSSPITATASARAGSLRSGLRKRARRLAAVESEAGRASAVRAATSRLARAF
jgi:hypothetical protein